MVAPKKPRFDRPSDFRHCLGMSQIGEPIPDFLSLFMEINQNHFDGFLDPPIMIWNTRLRSSAGRFFPGSRKYIRAVPPRIEVAAYLREEPNALALVKDTLAHEIIHYWLWVRRQPYGHTAEFISKMKAMGVSRYNPVPRVRPFKYLYQCAGCEKPFPARKKLGTLACADCCKRHAQGRYDSRFKLVLCQSLRTGDIRNTSESLQPVQQSG